ncbi:MAG: hypothetical protein IJX72_06220, partial [Clostridia bacterium]|nr:hypothetical protein [Clostridia bacterium]
SLALVISLLTGVAVFLPIDYLTGWDRWFPFVHPFQFVLIASLAALLYLALRGWFTTPRRCLLTAGILALLAAPQGLFCVLVYSAWICVALSVAVTTLLIVRAHRLHKRSTNS